jgi:hypothetical protein
LGILGATGALKFVAVEVVFSMEVSEEVINE